MNEPRVIAALSTLAVSTGELASICEREAPEFGGIWRRISTNASALATQRSRDDLKSLIGSIVRMFAYHPGSFTEVYIVRKDPTERAFENDRFDRAKERVSAAVAELTAAAREGEINFGMVRRYLTNLETSLLEAGCVSEAAVLRDFLGGGTSSVEAVMAVLDTLESTTWPDELRTDVAATVTNIRRELTVS